MSADFEQAVETLYRAPHESFVAERQRLAAELKGKGDKAEAARVAKLGRPTLSAWAVNQLWWHARADFERLFETAQQLRRGKHSASSAHRDALVKLTTRAKQLLHAGEHGTADATLRRINMTLAGLAAAGSFDPEPAGALTKDRDPPGFGAFGISTESDEAETEAEADEPEQQPKHSPKTHPHDTAERKRHEATEAKQQREKERAAAEAERQRLAEEKAQRAAERLEAESVLRDAKALLGKHEHEQARVEKELRAAEREVELAQKAVVAAEEQLAALKERA